MGVSHHGVRGLVAELTGEMKYKLNCFVLQLPRHSCHSCMQIHKCSNVIGCLFIIVFRNQ
jgi:hypothetical protein